ncbi:hypothetical protein ACSBR2_017806 [Camellia fascicularis]
METKNKVGVLERIRRRLQFPNSCYVDPVGTASGLALWWQDEVDIGIRSKSGGILRCVISMLNTKWLTTFIYATLRASQREVFWNCIWRIAWENQLPWLYIDGVDNVQERLDRAVARVSWRELFPYAQVIHEALIGSDHCSLILQVCIPPERVLRLFKFKSMWMTSPHCKSGIAFLKDQLVKLQVVPSSIENCQAQRQIQDELADVLQREEIFLHQQSRVHWLQCGDHNSTFFHASITQRRQRNQVIQLLNESDQRLTSDEDINAHFLDYFSKLFTSNNPRNLDEALILVGQLVTADMNSKLIRPVIDPEIKAAVFQ